MANPYEVLQVPFNQDGPIEFRPVDPGKVEPDDFIINDVALRIPPTKIRVDKKAFNREWQTLRTVSSQKVKSGHSLARVAFSIEFKVSQSTDLFNLTKLVAGLRATPFCVVHNQYLDRVLGRPDDTGPADPTNRQLSRQFRPIMLALSSMTFETQGDQNKADIICGHFDFLWFNYLPFTNFIAFKSGEDSSRPGFPWESTIWKKFYRPFEDISEPVNWPHDSNDIYARTTNFVWREFLILPKGDPMAAQAVQDILKAMRNKPTEVLNTANSLLTSSISSDAPNPDNINEGVYDALYRKLVSQGSINPNEEMRNYLNQATTGAITAASNDVLSPLIRKLNSKQSSNVFEEIDNATAIMADRIKKLTAVQPISETYNALADQDYVKILDTKSEYDIYGRKQFVGGLDLFGKKRTFRIQNIANPISPPEMVITRMTITFENRLATIPMVGYRYPTIQHIGSVDARVTFLIDSTNEGAKQLSQVYDSIETAALRFKQIPQGLNNLWINNDFLRMFGLSEFMTDALSVETIPSNPGRSMIQLMLTDAGITSADRLIDPEELQQENIQTSTGVRQDIWNALWKNTQINEGYKKRSPAAETFGSYVLDSIGFKSKMSNPVTLPTETAYYTVRLLNISANQRDSAIKSLTEEVVSAYNEVIHRVHDSIFGSGSFAPGVSGSRDAGLLFALEENDKTFGFIPQLNQIKQSVRERNKAYYAAGENSKVRDVTVTSNQSLEQLGKARDRAGVLLNNAAVNSSAQRDQLQVRKEAIQDMGITKYQRAVFKILDKISNKYLGLPQFHHIRRKQEQENTLQGLPAYPDFRKQLTSVAAGANSDGEVTNAQLNRLDPDCYFWYPVYDGAQSSPLSGFVDDYYILEAKRHSKSIAKNAQSGVGDFFQKTYLERLQNPKNNIPYERLTNDNGVSKVAEPFYQNDRIVNATRNTEKPIHKNVVIDSTSKSPVNWYDEKSPHIQSKALCVHTTNIDDLWNGVACGPNAYDLEVSNLSSNPQMTLPNEVDAESTKNINNNFQRNKDTPQFRWPIADPPRSMPPGYRFGALRRYNGTRQHIGIDVPEPSRGKKPWGVNDGIYGMQVFPIAPGVVEFIRGPTRVGGLRIGIDHGNDWHSVYMHLKPGSIKVKVGDRVASSQSIAQIGRTGVEKSPTHLHLQIRYKHEWIDPLRVMLQSDVELLNAQRFESGNQSLDRINSLAAQSVGRGVTSTLTSPLQQSINEFEKSLLNGQGQSMMRAYPTFKLYFIEDDSGKERKRLAFDDFFSYSSVQSIRIIENRSIAADLCEIYLTNISGVLSNRKFRQQEKSDQPHTNKGELTQETTNASRANTSQENPIASLLLQEGINIHLRLGYSNSPDRLEKVFNGVITEVEFSESDDLVKILAQTHAIELVQDIKGTEKPKKKSSVGVFGWDVWGFKNDAATGRILEEMMAEPEVLHFGRWNPLSETGNNNLRELLTQRWTFEPQPADDNIFAPHPSYDLGALSNGTFFNDLQYVIYRTTIWDIFQEMTLRHPNYIARAVPYTGKYGERMTMFFGLPNQLYFARDPLAEEEFADERLQQEQEKKLEELLESAIRQQFARKKELQNIALRAYRGPAFFLQDGFNQISLGKAAIALAIKKAGGTFALNESHVMQIASIAKENDSIKSAASNYFKQYRLEQAKQSGFIKPFRNYHLITSAQHIISNNICANSRDVANNIIIKYSGQVSDVEGETDVAIEGNEEEFSLKLDNAIPQEDLRTQMGQFVNVTNKELAQRYALGLLCNNIKNIYKGDLQIIGNPKIHVHDVCVDGSTLILTNQGYKPIKDINIGDIVYSHKSKQQKVSQLFKHKPYAKVLTVKCNTDPEELILTGNHPVLSVLRTDIYKNGKICNKQNHFIPEWRRIDELQEKDYLAQPRILTCKTLPVSLARLLGYYLAEGNILWRWRKSFNKSNKHNRKPLNTNIKCCRVPVGIQWSFNSETEMFMIDEINRLLALQGYTKQAKHYINQSKKDLRIVFNDRELASRFIQLAGYNDKEGLYKDNKWMRCFYDENTTKHILACYFEGDGSYSKEVKISACTTSFNLGRNIRQMLINLGIPVGSSISNIKSFSKQKSKAYYNVIPTTYTHEFAGYFTDQCRFAHTNTLSKSTYSGSTTSIVDDLFVYLRISSLAEYKNQDIDVYNIGVENDNSYIAQNKAVHNCYLVDEYTDMIGAFEVEEVEHVFDQHHGFRTIIKPDMLVQAAEWSLLGSCEAMGVVMEGALHKLMGTDGPATSIGGKTLSFMANMMGQGTALVGGFLSQKILNYTQLGQPVVMSPLLHHGRIFSGGVPTRKIPTSIWTTLLGEWTPNASEGFDIWMEDAQDRLLSWAKKYTFQNSIGDFWNNGADSPE